MNYKVVGWILRVAGLMLLWGLLPMDFVYYSYLRLAVCVAAVALWIAVSKTKQATWITLSIASLIIFPASWGLTADKATWAPIDVLFGIAYLIAAQSVSRLK